MSQKIEFVAYLHNLSTKNTHIGVPVTGHKNGTSNFCNNNNDKKIGKIFLAVSANEIVKLENTHKQALENGIEDLSLLEKKQLFLLEPEIFGIAGLLSPSTGIIDSHGLMSQLEKDVQKKEGLVYYNSEVISIEKTHTTYNISLKNQEDIIISPIVEENDRT